MFDKPFAFNGRIRRREFGLTLILYALVIAITDSYTKNGQTPGFMTIIYIALIWVVLAQGTKRCHDINNSGWCQIIPFYVLWMIFKNGDAYANAYGENPKQDISASPVTAQPGITKAIAYTHKPVSNTIPIANVISSLQHKSLSADPDLHLQTVLEVANTNYSLTQEILKKLRALNKTMGLTYTILDTKATITINHKGSSQMLLDSFYQTVENIEVLAVNTGTISIKIK